MRTSLLAGMTTRGICFLSAGAVSVLLGFVLGERGLLSVGVALIAAVREVHVAQQIRQYIIDIVAATRTAPPLRLGASPRAALHLLRASRAHAALDERDFVLPDDVQALAVPMLAHRLLPSAEAMVGRDLPEQVLANLVRRLPLPSR